MNVLGQVHRAEAALADRLAKPEIMRRPDLSRIGHDRLLRWTAAAVLCLCCRRRGSRRRRFVRDRFGDWRIFGGGIIGGAVVADGFVAVMLLLLLRLLALGGGCVVCGGRSGRFIGIGCLAGAAHHQVVLHFELCVVVFGEYRRFLFGHCWHRCGRVVVVLQKRIEHTKIRTSDVTKLKHAVLSSCGSARGGIFGEIDY